MSASDGSLKQVTSESWHLPVIDLLLGDLIEVLRLRPLGRDYRRPDLRVWCTSLGTLGSSCQAMAYRC